MEPTAQKQDTQTFLEDLYSRYKLPLLKIIQKYVGNSDVSEDIFHEVFIRIIKNVEMLKVFPRPKLEAYIILVAKGVSIDYFRKTNNKLDTDVDEEVFSYLLAKSGPIGTNSFDPFKRVELLLMLENIPTDEKILLVGKYYLGLSTTDLSEILGITAVAVRSKLHRSKKHIFNEWTKTKLNMGDFVDE